MNLDLRKESIMTVERALRLIAGAFVVLSVLLGMYTDAGHFCVHGVRRSQPVSVGVHPTVPMMVILQKSGLRDAGQ